MEKNTYFKKPKISALIAPDVVVDVATLQLWCRGLTFGVTTVDFSCPCNVTTLGFNVATLLIGYLYNTATLNVIVATLL